MQIELALITSVVETVLYTGLIFGWSSLQPVLIKEGFFSELCSNTTVQCDEQSKALNLVYSLSTSSGKIMCFLCGLLIDKKGIWFSRTVFLFSSSIAFILTAVSKPGLSSWLFYISFPLQSIAGFGLLTVNLQTCSLATKFRATIVCLVSGAFDSSSVMLLFVKYLYELNVSFSTCFFFLAGLSLLFHIRTFLLTPKMQISFNTPVSFAFGFREMICFAAQEANTQEEETHKVQSDQNIDEKSLKECLKEIYLWSFFLYFSFIQFTVVYSFGVFDKWIKAIAPKNEFKTFINLFGISNFLSIFWSLIVGATISFLRKQMLTKLPPSFATLKAITITHSLTIFLTFLILVFKLINNSSLQYLTSVLLTINKSFLHSSASSYIACTLPSKHFSFIHGFMQALGGVILLLQYPLTLLLLRVLNNNFNILFSILLLLPLVSTFHPVMKISDINKKSKVNLKQTSGVNEINDL